MVGLGRGYKEKVGLGNVVWILGGKWQFFIFFLPLEENRDCTQRNRAKARMALTA